MIFASCLPTHLRAVMAHLPMFVAVLFIPWVVDPKVARTDLSVISLLRCALVNMMRGDDSKSMLCCNAMCAVTAPLRSRAAGGTYDIVYVSARDNLLRTR